MTAPRGADTSTEVDDQPGTPATVDDTPPEEFRDYNTQLRYEYLELNLELQKALEAGDEAAAEKIRRRRALVGEQFVAKNTRFAQSLASQFMINEPGEHLQAALFGLWKAFAGSDPELADGVIVGEDGKLKPTAGWDPAKGTFTTWAGNFISGEVKRSVRGSEGAFNGISYHTWGQKPKVDKARRELAEELGHTPSFAQIAERAGVTVETVRACSNAAPKSLDATVGDGGTTLGDLVADTTSGSGTYDVSADLAEAHLASQAENLGTTDLMVMLLRKGIVTEAPRSVVQTADKLGIGRGHVAVALNRAERRLTEALQRS